MSDILKLLVKVRFDIHEGPFGSGEWSCFETIDAASYVVGEFHDDGTVTIIDRWSSADVAIDYASVMEPDDVGGMVHWPADSVLCDLLLADGADLQDM